MAKQGAPAARITRTRRPMLLALVYGVSLLLSSAVAVALAVLTGAHFSAAMLNTSVAHDRALIGLWADASVGAADLSAGALPSERATVLGNSLATLAARSGISQIQVRNANGGLIVASAATTQNDLPAEFAVAAAGNVSASVIDHGASAAAASGPVIQEFLPLVDGATGDVVAVVAIWRDARPALAALDAARTDVLIVTGSAAMVLAVVLTIIFRAAQRRLARQGAALLETARRDPLTGMLNHGASVAALAERLELARGAGASLSLALIDVDNFRLLNASHGHEAGDAVLRHVSALLGELAPAGCVTGRFGPDEFIVIGPPVADELVERLVDSLRSRLKRFALRFGESESLPVTISAGIATFPTAAQGATDLLASATNAVGDAKSSGGDAVRTSGSEGPQPIQHPTFNALQGLVIAVDTKDRYTKRHSEDVARYAVFVGRHLGLHEAQLEQLRVAGLLHDVGKVGIPDAILRKPSALNADERAIVEQHVALGDLIVRDLPDIEIVRAGVRYHHERWDGSGYLEHRAGEEIPTIARILAVCDTFSAMTTTRPYRKAMSVNEALKRLGDAAGTQLDERIVTAFVRAMESAADAPHPEDDTARVRLWLPARAT